MARGAKVTINRANANALALAIHDGLVAFAKTVIAGAHPPDRTPYGEGLVDRGGVIGYVDGKKVSDTTINGEAIKKPRGVSTPKGAVVVIAGWGFPARFQEFGTVRQPARPFLTPVKEQVTPRGADIAATVIRPAVKALP